MALVNVVAFATDIGTPAKVIPMLLRVLEMR
jgi:hypothetical protein